MFLLNPVNVIPELSRGHPVFGGDKDYTNYVGSNGVEVKDGNQRIKLTMAYNRYTNVGQRLPMIRQGVGHGFNNFFDNSTHQSATDSVAAISTYGSDKLSRGINARNGASIAADTNVYNAFNEPQIGAERQGVNSTVTNSSGTYTGSSWDNNGVNAFTNGMTWYDKSTIGNWAWSSHIIVVENMSKLNPPTSPPFTFTYGYNEQLPYAYQTFPLSSVISTVTQYRRIKSYFECCRLVKNKLWIF